MRLSFRFYEVYLDVNCARPELRPVCESLREDFSYFLASSADARVPSTVLIEIPGEELPTSDRPRLPRLFKTRICDVYGFGGSRICDYGAGTWVKATQTGSARKFIVYGLDADRVYEAAYLAALSSVGEALDRLGYHRMHALAWESSGARGFYFAAPGYGKSAAAALMRTDAGVRLLSDESPLIRGKTVFPFPLRIALRPSVAGALGLDVQSARIFRRKIYPEKALFQIPNSCVGESGEANLLLLAKGAASGEARVSEAGCLDKLKFLASFVMGLGLAQMSEHMIRGGNLLALARIALSRLRTGVGLLSTVKVAAWQASADARVNSKALKRQLSASHEAVESGTDQSLESVSAPSI